jgi:branched-chain amino acid transport system ATP-binding protein
MAMLEVKDLAVSFDDFKILWDISLSVEKGEIVAVVGSNGAGKSTLLNTISGLIHPSSGSVAVFGEED